MDTLKIAVFLSVKGHGDGCHTSIADFGAGGTEPRWMRFRVEERGHWRVDILEIGLLVENYMEQCVYQKCIVIVIVVTSLYMYPVPYNH